MLEIAAGRMLVDGDGWGRHFGRDHGPHWWAMLALLLLTGAVVALVVWIVLRLTQRRPPAGTALVGARPDAALEELRLRYARGEVDRDSFLRAASDLGAPAIPGPASGPSGSVASGDTTPS